jgi:hypothetical protein
VDFAAPAEDVAAQHYRALGGGATIWVALGVCDMASAPAGTKYNDVVTVNIINTTSQEVRSRLGYRG